MHLKPLTWSQKKSCQTKKRVFVGIKPPNFKILFILFCSGKWSAQPQLRQSREKAMMLIFNYGDFCTEGQTGLENFVWICDNVTLRENCPNLSFFLSVFSFIWTKYRDLRRKSPYSFQVRENTDKKKLRIWTVFTECKWLMARRSLNEGDTNFKWVKLVCSR